MARYIQKTHRDSDYPDRAIASVAHVKITNAPDWLQSDEGRSELKDKLIDVAGRTSKYLGSELDAEVRVVEGSVIIDVILPCPLSEFLSDENLKRIGVWVTGGIIIAGVAEGTKDYVAHMAFRSIGRLERAVKRVLSSISFDVITKANGTLMDRENKSLINEDRTGVLGNLRRYYEAIGVARSNVGLKSRVGPMKRAFNNASDINATVLNIDDRAFLCNLMSPILESVKFSDLKTQESDEFNEALEGTQDVVFNKLCGRSG